MLVTDLDALRADYESLQPIEIGAQIKDWDAVMRLLNAIPVLLDEIEALCSD